MPAEKNVVCEEELVTVGVDVVLPQRVERHVARRALRVRHRDAVAVRRRRTVRDLHRCHDKLLFAGHGGARVPTLHDELDLLLTEHVPPRREGHRQRPRHHVPPPRHVYHEAALGRRVEVPVPDYPPRHARVDASQRQQRDGLRHRVLRQVDGDARQRLHREAAFARGVGQTGGKLVHGTRAAHVSVGGVGVLFAAAAHCAHVQRLVAGRTLVAAQVHLQVSRGKAELLLRRRLVCPAVPTLNLRDAHRNDVGQAVCGVEPRQTQRALLRTVAVRASATRLTQAVSARVAEPARLAHGEICEHGHLVRVAGARRGRPTPVVVANPPAAARGARVVSALHQTAAGAHALDAAVAHRAPGTALARRVEVGVPETRVVVEVAKRAVAGNHRVDAQRHVVQVHCAEVPARREQLHTDTVDRLQVRHAERLLAQVPPGRAARRLRDVHLHRDVRSTRVEVRLCFVHVHLDPEHCVGARHRIALAPHARVQGSRVHEAERDLLLGRRVVRRVQHGGPGVAVGAGAVEEAGHGRRDTPTRLLRGVDVDGAAAALQRRALHARRRRAAAQPSVARRARARTAVEALVRRVVVRGTAAHIRARGGHGRIFAAVVVRVRDRRTRPVVDVACLGACRAEDVRLAQPVLVR
eukprot:Rhum_TRINITY_DN20795_c0_g2::Rhum_TRINITY_DN20795_c0_g2_i1::g.172152::m.172152